MATINEITSGQSYVGNAALGGYIPDAITIDTNPVMQLAAYTKMNNEALFKQRQVDADQRIQQLAELSKYNINDAVGKDREAAIEAYTNLHTYAAEQARLPVPRTPKEKIEQEAAFQLKIKEATDKIINLNKRGIAYKTQLNQINSDPTTDIKEKMVERRRLESKLNDSQWYESISDKEKYAIPIPTLGEPVVASHQVNVKQGNDIINRTFSIFDYDKTMDASGVDAAGFADQKPGPNATQEEKDRYEIIQARGGSQKAWQDAAGALNTAIQSGNFKDANGNVDIEKLRAGAGDMAAEIYVLGQRANQYGQEMKERIRDGFYTTKMGEQVPLDVMKNRRYDQIDLSKPLTPKEIIFLGKFAKAAPDKVDEKIQWTGEALTRQNMLLDAQVAREGQRNAWNIANLPYKNIKLTQGGQALGQQEYSPLASIVAAAGTLNKPIPVTQLSIAQAAAINPGWVVDGALTEEGAKAVISVGGINQNTDKAGKTTGVDYGVFILGDDGKAKRSLNESNLLSNGASWLATAGKESKGQDAYEFKQDLFYNAFGKNAKTGQSNKGATPKVGVVKKTPTSTTVTTITRADLATKAALYGHSIAEYQKLLEEKGIKIKD